MMKNAIVLLAALLLLNCTGETGETTARGINWIKDYRQGLAHAQESGKPMMLFFTADWCPPCLEMKKNVFSDARVIEASLELVNIYIDVDKDRRTLTEYRVRVIPEIFFLTSRGETVVKIVGPRGVSDLVEQMRSVTRAHRGS